MTASATQERSGDSETPRVTALDQWRGLALVLVLVAHAFHESGRVDGLGRVGARAGAGPNRFGGGDCGGCIRP
jgi:peptidoglycan/LPS O-acetylase OafA/YrhL